MSEQGTVEFTLGIDTTRFEMAFLRTRLALVEMERDHYKLLAQALAGAHHAKKEAD